MERPVKTGQVLLSTAFMMIMLLAMGCVVGPRYARPPVQTPPAYKEIPQPREATPESWRTSQPKDGIDRGKWWTVFNDPQLDGLEERACSSNRRSLKTFHHFPRSVPSFGWLVRQDSGVASVACGISL